MDDSTDDLTDRVLTIGRHTYIMSMEDVLPQIDVLNPVRLLTDDEARTIATWWQSSGTVGRHLAQLASTCSVPLQDLLDDIDATWREAGTDWDRRSLDQLKAWALNHKSVKE